MNMVDSGDLLFHDSMLATAASCCCAIILVADTASVVSIYNKKRAMRSKSKVKSCWFVQSEGLFCQ